MNDEEEAIEDFIAGNRYRRSFALVEKKIAEARRKGQTSVTVPIADLDRLI